MTVVFSYFCPFFRIVFLFSFTRIDCLHETSCEKGKTSLTSAIRLPKDINLYNATSNVNVVKRYTSLFIDREGVLKEQLFGCFLLVINLTVRLG